VAQKGEEAAQLRTRGAWFIEEKRLLSKEKWLSKKKRLN
jgi:hypothetical protein